MKYLLLALCESCPSLRVRTYEITLTVEKPGQTSCPMLYAQPLNKIEAKTTMRSALNKTFCFYLTTKNTL